MEMVLVNNRTAIEAWGRGFAAQAKPWNESPGITCMYEARHLEHIAPLLPALSTPVSIATQTPRNRNRSAHWQCQVWSRPFPPHSLWKLCEPNVLISAPWFCFLQMASKLNLADAIRLGMELCGTHSTLPFSPRIIFSGTLTPEEIKRGFVKATPITNVRQLRAGLASLSDHKYATAVIAAQYIIDGSRSPAESRVYIIFCLPAKRGGYGLPRPVLNETIPLPEHLRNLCGSPYYIADFYYPNHGLVVEFDGHYHWEGNVRMDDNVRDLIFRELGITVIRMGKRQIENPLLMDLQVQEICRHLGIQYREPTDYVLKARTKLRKEALNWSSDLYGA